MRNQQRIFTLNEPNAPRLNPALACEIGLNESLILLQIEYWISISDNHRDGRKWTYQSVRDMRKKSFPFWSIATISRAVNRLIKEGYLLEGNYNQRKYDNTRWFALNFDKLKYLKSISIQGHETGVFQNETGVFQNETGVFQNETTIPKTTTKTTTKITTHSPEEEEKEKFKKTFDEEEIKRVVCVLDKKISLKDSKKLLTVAKGDIDLIKAKYQIAKETGYRNLTAYMISAIKGDWDMPKSSRGNLEKKTAFHNFEQRSSKYSEDDINRLIASKKSNL